MKHGILCFFLSLNVCLLVLLSHQCPVVLKRIRYTEKQGILCFLRTSINSLYFESLPISVFVPHLHVWCCSGGQDRNKGSYVSLGREAEWAGQASGCLACCWLEQGQEGTMRWCETNFIPSWQFHLPAYPTYLPTYLPLGRDQCACARQILSPRGNFTCHTTQAHTVRPTKRPVTWRNPLGRCPLLILSPRRVAISPEESPCCPPNRDKFYSRVAISLAQALAQRVTRRNLVAPISPTPPIRMPGLTECTETHIDNNDHI